MWSEFLFVAVLIASGVLAIRFGHAELWFSVVGVCAFLTAGLHVLGYDPIGTLLQTTNYLEATQPMIFSRGIAYAVSFWIFINAIGLLLAASVGVAARMVVGEEKDTGKSVFPFTLAGSLFLVNAAYLSAGDSAARALGW